MTFFNLLDRVGIVVTEDVSVLSVSAKTIDKVETYDVTGTSPQSSTVAQLLKGLASSGTL